jgi:hypothetical protein
VLPGLAQQLDLALTVLLADETTVPLSPLVALLLNFAATLVDPLAVNGAFLSPFSRLDFQQKTAAFRLLETEAATVAAQIDQSISESVKNSISGLIEFLASALLTENPRLWLNSRLPNPNGWVGRGYTDHYFDWLVGVFENDTFSTRGVGSSAQVDWPGHAGLEQVGLPPALQAFSLQFSNSGMQGFYDNGSDALDLGARA